MTTNEYIFFIYIATLILVYMVSFYKIFPKAGLEKWEGLVPGYNVYAWLKVIKSPWWWMFFLLIPGLNFLMMIVMNVELGRAFKKFTWQETLKFALLPHWGILELAYKGENDVYFEGTDWAVEEHRKEREMSDHVGLALTLPVIGHALVYALKLTGTKDKPKKKTLVKEWGDSILFAVVAASIIRSLFFEAFTIPTGSMEKNLLVGDYLFVSKVSYGPKLPNTPLSIPFVHNTIPFLNTKSYVEWWKMDYHRLPGLGDVERNDVVVFNFPAGDTAINDPGVTGLMGHTYSSLTRDLAFTNYLKSEYIPSKVGFDVNKFTAADIDNFYANKLDSYYKSASNSFKEEYGLIKRPVDKRENYIKRCVAIPGDSLKIINRELYVNGKKSGDSENMQFNYKLKLSAPFDDEALKENHNITIPQKFEERYRYEPNGDLIATISLTKEVLKVMQSGKYKNVIDIDTSAVNDFKHYVQYGKCLPIYPNHPKFKNWTEDNYGPIYIPKKGDKIDLTNEDNYIIYHRVITAFENHTLEKKDGKILLDGAEVTEYEMEMDYYWLMGDNRNGSADSRFWGFVPEDHVVGKAVLIWFSKDQQQGWFDGGVRWNRIFKSIE